MRQHKPTSGVPPKWVRDNEEPKANHDIRRLKEVSKVSNSNNVKSENISLKEGQIIMHERFGKGKILNLEGVGADKKAEIRFDTGGIKKLLLRFAKLNIIE